jgi:hypothetical protein
VIADHDSGGSQDVGSDADFAVANLVLIDLARNDFAGAGTAAAALTAMESLLSYMYGINAGARYCLCEQIADLTGSIDAKVDTYNTGLPALIATRQGAGQDIELVPFNAGLTLIESSGGGGDYADATHLNAQGYGKQATYAIAQLLLNAGYA